MNKETEIDPLTWILSYVDCVEDAGDITL